jgi:hypothetical protein
MRPAAELPTLIGQLEAAEAHAWARLTAPPVATRVATGDGAALKVAKVARHAFMYEALTTVVERPQD